MENSDKLNLPFIAASQAQKHVTHNEAIRALDAIVQLGVLDRDLSVPPGSPGKGDRYLVAAGASGAWTGHDGAVAAWQDGTWMFYSPQEGWLVWVEDEESLIAWDGAGWKVIWGDDALQDLAHVGINSVADNTNRLSVSAPSSLFSHEGAGHRLKLNKAATAHTASLLFQTAFTSHAEIGTTGDDKLHVKLSSDGSTWKEGLTIADVSGNIYVGLGTPVPSRAFHASGAHPELLLEDTAGPADMKRFNVFMYQGGTAFRGLNDAGNGGTTWLYARNDTGQVGFGTYAPTSGYKVEVVGDIRCTSLTQTSDANRKTVVGTAPGLEFVRLLKPVQYKWKAQEARRITRERPGGADGMPETEVITVQEARRAGSRTHFGLLAQDVKAAADELGIEFGGYKNTLFADPDKPEEHLLDYTQLLPPLVRAVQELAARVEALE